MGRGILTVANDDGVDDQGQESGLVLGRVVLEEGLGVVVADGHILGAVLGVDGGGSRGGDGNLVETHDECVCVCFGGSRKMW